MALVCDTLVVTATPNTRAFLLVGGYSLILYEGPCFSFNFALPRRRPKCRVNSRGSRQEPAVSHSTQTDGWEWPQSVLIPWLLLSCARQLTCLPPPPTPKNNMFTHCALRRQAAVV